MQRIKTHRGMTIGEAEQIMAYVCFHYDPETDDDLVACFNLEARNRGFRPTATCPANDRLHENWERA
jgi:hypothetical protein